jgi:hypothetical protein
MHPDDFVRASFGFGFDPGSVFVIKPSFDCGEDCGESTERVWFGSIPITKTQIPQKDKHQTKF